MPRPSRAAYQKQWRELNPEKQSVHAEKNKIRSYKHLLKKKYGLGWDEAQEILSTGCLICGSMKKLCIDHDHLTGIVRGCLCNGCNAGLGYFRDNPVFLVNAIQYLRNHDDKSL